MIAANTHASFRLASIEELRAAAIQLGLDIAADDDVSVLAQPVEVQGHILPNAMAVQPMEGCDATAAGAPDSLTFRRYRRFAAGGAGLLWFEACAVVPQGRANPRQLWLHRETRDEFARLLDESRRAAAESMGSGHRPLAVLQLTHSGRYSRPVDAPKPIIAYHDPILDADRGIPPDYPVISDSELEALEDAYVAAAKLAFEVGFDAVDIKACHRYLVNELLAAHTREGRYGGSYENRTRLLRNVIGKVRAAVGPEQIITCRLGIHDSHPYPYGWGMDPNDPTRANLDEPKRLVRELHELGLPLVDITMGNPYFNPHVNRPYDRPIEGATRPDEHPLVGIARLVGLTREVQRHVPEIVTVGSGYSWLRNLWPHVAAANIRGGAMRIAGLGRQAFAYPGFAKEIIETGRLDRRHTCIGCSSCTQIMRDGGRAGCVPFDAEVYGPIYREGRLNNLERVRTDAARCRDCLNATCRDGCPAGVDVPAFLRALADGDIRKSYDVLRSRNTLPEVCGYVCPSEVQCELKCVERVFTGSSVPIRRLQRYVSRTARAKGWVTAANHAEPTGKSVAVVGAGPAGLACAVRLLEMGHRVEMFDVREQLGGTALGAIPTGRLRGEDFLAEANAALAEYERDRFAFKARSGLGPTRNLDWFAGGFDAVFLGMGLGASVSLDETRPDGVEDAIAFLEGVKRGEAAVPERVAVLGGGNTAMDAAVEAASLGARDVYVVYRRSFAEMPAWPEQRDEAVKLGVHFLILTQPVRYNAGADGRLNGLVIARTTLGEPDQSGRRRPVIVPDSESVLDVELVLEALGQNMPARTEDTLPGVELTPDRLVRVDERGRTSREGVFAGGDITSGGATVVQAIAEGMRAAEAVDAYLSTKR